METLLETLKAVFVELYRPFLTAFVASLHAASDVAVQAVSLDFREAFKDWDKAFDKLLSSLESRAANVRRRRL